MKAPMTRFCMLMIMITTISSTATTPLTTTAVQLTTLGLDHHSGACHRPMTGGREVVEDYVHTGLSLRAHPASFLRDEFRRKLITCEQAMRAPDNQWLETAGIVLVRQKPGSAKGMMFIAIEDDTGLGDFTVSLFLQ